MIRMSEATVVYENGTRAVNKASLRVDEGEFVFLVGASGSGKTDDYQAPDGRGSAE